MARQKTKLRPADSIEVVPIDNGFSEPTDIQTLFNSIEVLDTAPSDTPVITTFYDQIKIFNDGATRQLYIYDTENNIWLKATLTI